MLNIQYAKKNDMSWAYALFGKGPVEIVIEMGLEACIGEWYHLAEQIGEKHTVLLYERAGVDLSSPSNRERTPQNIARELFLMLSELKCQQKMILIGHSQGGLYVQQAARMYPERVKGILLLDPLSPDDNEFQDRLTNREYKRSGVDKTMNIKLMKLMTQWHMGNLVKKMMAGAPPFYYEPSFSVDAKKNILEGLTKTTMHQTALEEYELAHTKEVQALLSDPTSFPDLPLVLITHNSEAAIQENMQFGHNDRAFAEKVEAIWQELMKRYLSFSIKSKYLQAARSTHYLHLTEPALIGEALEWLDQ